MAFELPDLDTRDSATLQTELIRRIPQFTRLWTDYNDSDPGITLLQLLSWMGESLLYQNNAIPIQTDQNFLREVLGLAFTSNSTPYSEAADKNYDFAFQALRGVLGEVDAGIALTRAQLQHAVLDYQDTPYLALTCDDVQALALETNQMIAAQQASASDGSTPLLVKRADAQLCGEATCVYILSDAKWTYQYPTYPNVTQPDVKGGRRSMLMLQPPMGQAADDAAGAEKKLLNHVNTYLAPRVLLGNRVNVRPAQLTAIDLAVAVRCASNVVLKTVLDVLMKTLFAYFKPDQTWQYDQPPVLENLQHLIEEVPGVVGIENLQLSYAPTAQCPWLAQLDVNALLADLPAGSPGLFYRGLPCVRCLDLFARNAA